MVDWAGPKILATVRNADEALHIFSLAVNYIDTAKMTEWVPKIIDYFCECTQTSENSKSFFLVFSFYLKKNSRTIVRMVQDIKNKVIAKVDE